MLWDQWWLWVVLGFGLATLEVFIPGYIFLGSAAGAVVMGLLIALGLGGLGLGFVIFIFALISLAAWFGLRKIFGKGMRPNKIWDRDINDL